MWRPIEPIYLVRRILRVLILAQGCVSVADGEALNSVKVQAPRTLTKQNRDVTHHASPAASTPAKDSD
jgi:hypothetical protein